MIQFFKELVCIHKLKLLSVIVDHKFSTKTFSCTRCGMTKREVVAVDGKEG